MMNSYRMKTMKQLVEGYVFEAGRTNREDREVTQKAIVKEMYRRMKITFDMLDKNPEEWEQIYKQLIEF